MSTPNSAHRGRGSRPPRGGSARGRGADNGRSRGRGVDSGRGRRGLPVAPDGSIEYAPRGVCRYYWSTGSCNRNFDCTFQHISKQPASAQEEQQQRAQETADNPGDIDFFSTEGLAVHSGAAVDDQYRLKPSEAHNFLKPFLVDSYTFANGMRIEGFTRIFASINDRNKAWDSGHAQTFLDFIVHGNGLLRIGEVLRYKPVCVDVGADQRNLGFQRGYFPLLEFMTCDLILKTTMHQNVNALYTTVEQSFDELSETLSSSMSALIQRKSWNDASRGGLGRQNSLSGVTVFRALTALLAQLFLRFKTFIKNHPELQRLVDDLVQWFQSWSFDVSLPAPVFSDPITSSSMHVRSLTIQEISKDIDRLQAIVNRDSGLAARARRTVLTQVVSAADRQQARIAQLNQIYVGPGECRAEGPRHDNDFADIRMIRIAPTHEELLAPSDPGPYLPAALPDAPHHIPRGSIERHIDIQFRLLREELISSIRTAIQMLHSDVDSMLSPPQRYGTRMVTRLETVLARRGGAYKTDSIFFHLYSNIRFAPINTERRFAIGLVAAAPDGPARDKAAKKRMEYWEHGKRLQHGSLIALVIVSPGNMRVHLGTIASVSNDIAESARPNAEDISFRAEFFDAEVALMALRRENISRGDHNFSVVIDCGIMYPAIAPFLRQLQSAEPREIPFASIIASADNLQGMEVQPPRYARAPRFRFKLQCLAKEGARIEELNASDAQSIIRARVQLRENSSLDPSQVEAVVDTFVREVSLIQGPPGTGKSFTGKEILRVLFASSIRPIVLIAFTNHALDHMISSVLDAGITTNIVRLGSMSKDERVSEFNLAKLEAVGGRNAPARAYGRARGEVRELEENMRKVMDDIQLPRLSSDKVMEFLNIWFPELWESFSSPPFWIMQHFSNVQEDEKNNGEWTTVEHKKSKDKEAEAELSGIYGFWKQAYDIQFVAAAEHAAATRETPRQGQSAPTTPLPSSSSSSLPETPQAAASSPDFTTFFRALGFDHHRPLIPQSSRPLVELLSSSNVWAMSVKERLLLAAHLEEEMRHLAYQNNLDEFNMLRQRYEAACEELENVKNESRRMLLSRTDLIGCTTTGMAHLSGLMIKPKVLLVEEAGQVLESHIIAALVPSVEHLICIGDPQQLRPNLANFMLSMDSQSGRDLYKFDRSLMERLASSNWPMSQINVQRRMRPSISHFIRTILYPKLEDHEVVHHYPPVQGIQREVVFFSHANHENTEADSVSKYNIFEVGIIRDLVIYFLKQDEYNNAGDIAVLCAYLGQLQKVRAALRDLKIAVTVSERDEEQLLRQGEEIGMDGFEQVQVSRHIRLGTVDTFQGEEAKIVIVSLVRNSGSFEEGSSIGFLKSSNRINVALSRAKHGLYIIGNASNLRQNPTWRKVLDEMEADDQISPGIPVVCPRHPEQRMIITKPGQLATFSPEGGCLLPCEYRMPCGHVCQSVCHVDRDGHRRMKCDQPCLRIQCPRNHPCPKTCSEVCGNCLFPIYNVTLPCGHVKASVACFEMDDLSIVFCDVKIPKHLQTCEHSATMACSEDPSRVYCGALCGGSMQCCTKACKSKCSECQTVTRRALGHSLKSEPASGLLPRIHHLPHPCERTLVCQHQCGLPCSEGHRCNVKCENPCRQRCTHHSCPKQCSAPCPPCMEPCQWRCPHDFCPVVCGSICSRLPCDEPCDKTLKCGHPCPSVCGEPCERQICVTCASEDKKADIVDWLLQRTLSEIDLASVDIADRLITLDCSHVFTVETLDGICDMRAYYEVGQIGEYLDTKAPPVEYQKPPCCPTCRGAITALRYGRVTKRANLDILEQNVASTMSQALDAVGPDIAALSEGIETTLEATRKIPYAAPKIKAEEFDGLDMRRRALLDKQSDSEPLGPALLSQAQMVSTHGFAPEEARAWMAASGVRAILKAYRKVHEVAYTHGPHVKAYAAALATLYRLELAAIAEDPLRACERPEPAAMVAVNARIGQPPHKADTRFQAEALFFLLELRFLLAQAAQARLSSLTTTSEEPNAQHHHRLWASFVQFLHEMCLRDAHKALDLASRSSASRIAARATIHILRAQVEQFRFNIMLERDNGVNPGPLSDERRDEFLRRVEQREHEAQRFIDRAKTAYIRTRPVQTAAELWEERLWFEEECGSKVQRFFDEFDNLREIICKNVLYQPLSLQEREDIVRAFNFATQGHFYNCPNGHTFVITECGGAMQASTCPECRAPIGGGNHALLRSNTRAEEFDEVARNMGARESYWADPWGEF
ncbi:hypothetical protein K488DRAFT_58479 [Vararia minispora EC-137]|uniref:Uncharacterized protein n=1 Tax=Vararia minispora EC-137 TaxID=1314806 RepID=A0ACB8QA87_9AGAM|nr:hypothetical protein K488DRAFT_58479 [Vararia minispora EC-137]